MRVDDPTAWESDVPEVSDWMQHRVECDLSAFKEFVESPPME